MGPRRPPAMGRGWGLPYDHAPALGQERFYGTLTIRLEAGRVTTVRKEATRKPPGYPHALEARAPRHYAIAVGKVLRQSLPENL